MMVFDETTEEMMVAVGEQLRALRVSRNIDQKTLAERAGVSLRALRNLEGGQGSTLHTLVCVVRALGRQDWLRTVGPVATINPLMLNRAVEPRQRASKPRIARGKA
ncbi:MAG TPA: helix-turn-helix transcriptional regulator [Aquabacterium sp.]|uniref:helix-turn-helix domain-containing protein n=1 Tax=Aquabacterium sp. TaxID=1872578 RepID=UPI002E340AEE|nr:helix-turn-helix transcriptional regulator [Aquabacterium sp.]HEX5372855.1 helix-turn-helix transcriptional regulator [Aquabacterium sp.]